MISTLISATITANIPFNSISGRIIGGYEVSPKFRWPWIVSLAHNGIYNCGGTLFNGKTVIRAAHCDNGSISSWTAHIHHESFERGRTYSIRSRIAHPNYDTNTNAFDVSIWKLNTATGTFAGVELENSAIADFIH